MTPKRIVFGIILIAMAILIAIYFKLALDTATPKTSVLNDNFQSKHTNFKDSDSVSISASTSYRGDLFKNLLQGDNYRQSWEAKVTVPILYLDTLYGGAEIIKIGGGKQTHSLRLETADGRILTLRSVNKNPEALVPKFVENLKLENVVMDGISGQHPYAALVVAELAETVNLYHTHPKLVFLPEQKGLDKDLNTRFGNQLYLLEYENKGDYNWTQFDDIKEIIDTEDLQKLKGKLGPKLTLDKKQLIRARLFDIIIGDWDRHAKQWGWIIETTDTLYNAVPLPMDRDNAFFDVDGLINSVITLETITPHLQSFEKEVDYMDGLVYDFDVYFLQNTTKDDFIEQAQYLKEKLTDTKIEEAFEVWNTEIYNLDAEDIIFKLKSRRDQIEQLAKRFKAVLDTKPLLNSPLKGSEKSDTKNSAITCFEC